jgi:hypothetical protein
MSLLNTTALDYRKDSPVSELSEVLVAVSDVKTSVEKTRGDMINEVKNVEIRLGERISRVETKLADRIGKNHGRLSGLEARVPAVETDVHDMKTNCKAVHPPKMKKSDPPPPEHTQQIRIVDAGEDDKQKKMGFLSMVKYVVLGGIGLGTTIYTVISLISKASTG